MFENLDEYNINMKFYVLLAEKEAEEYLNWIVKNRNNRSNGKKTFRKSEFIKRKN